MYLNSFFYSFFFYSFFFWVLFGGLLYNWNLFCFDWSDLLNVSVVQPPESPLLLSSSTHSQQITKKQNNKQPTKPQQRSVKRKGKHRWGHRERGACHYLDTYCRRENLQRSRSRSPVNWAHPGWAFPCCRSRSCCYWQCCSWTAAGCCWARNREATRCSCCDCSPLRTERHLLKSATICGMYIKNFQVDAITKVVNANYICYL